MLIKQITRSHMTQLFTINDDDAFILIQRQMSNKNTAHRRETLNLTNYFRPVFHAHAQSHISHNFNDKHNDKLNSALWTPLRTFITVNS
jgi:hypothetical protein